MQTKSSDVKCKKSIILAHEQKSVRKLIEAVGYTKLVEKATEQLRRLVAASIENNFQAPQPQG